ncbi:MAG: potassium/proton antiporter [Bacteroidales bacterium]|nr:potassium/proton antiporter [Bacteroidales bacterium]
MLPLAVFSVDLISDNLLLLASVLVFVAVLITKAGVKLGAPSLLLFLLLGMLVGSEGLGLKFEDYEIAESIGHFAMTVILFTGGFETVLSETRPVMRRGIMLSTVGICITVILTGLFIFFVTGRIIADTGVSILACFLVAAVMSSTDSTSVFSVLNGKRLRLRSNLAPLLELESGSNDPVAYILTILIVKFMTEPSLMELTPGVKVAAGIIVVLMQILIGVAVGFGVGFGGKWLLSKIRLENSSLMGILVLSTGFFANGLASVLGGQGLLAIYIAAVIISNKADIARKKEIAKFFDGITWIMQLAMFLILGLLARPSSMVSVALPAILTGLFLIFVARPASVFLTLAPFRGVKFKEKLFVSWVGLKGAGPILFALYPVVHEVQGASDIFNVVFIVSLMSLILQGMSLTPVAKWLNLSYPEDPEVESFGMELPEEMGLLSDHVVTQEDLSAGKTLRELHLPHGIRVMMVKREGKFLVPHGSMELMEGDHLVIVMGESDD